MQLWEFRESLIDLVFSFFLSTDYSDNETQLYLFLSLKAASIEVEKKTLNECKDPIFFQLQ